MNVLRCSRQPAFPDEPQMGPIQGPKDIWSVLLNRRSTWAGRVDQWKCCSTLFLTERLSWGMAQ